jgi:hypothetical protein
VGVIPCVPWIMAVACGSYSMCSLDYGMVYNVVFFGQTFHVHTCIVFETFSDTAPSSREILTLIQNVVILALSTQIR